MVRTTVAGIEIFGYTGYNLKPSNIMINMTPSKICRKPFRTHLPRYLSTIASLQRTEMWIQLIETNRCWKRVGRTESKHLSRWKRSIVWARVCLLASVSVCCIIQFRMFVDNCSCFVLARLLWRIVVSMDMRRNIYVVQCTMHDELDALINRIMFVMLNVKHGPRGNYHSLQHLIDYYFMHQNALKI